jgi:hypothetical protein
MIRLVTDRGDLDLRPDTRIEWIVTNPFFEEDESFMAQLSLPFNLPLTANNQRLMGYAEELQVSNYDLSVGVNMLVDGVLFFRGRLNLLMPGSNGYQCSLGYDRAVIDTKRSIRDYNYGGARSGAGSAANRTAANLLSYPQTDFVWPHVWNTDPEKNAAYNGGNILINDFSFAGGTYQNKELAVPMPFLSYVMKTVFNEMGGIDVNGSFWESEDIKKKVIYNPVVANIMTSETVQLYLQYDPAFSFSNTGNRNMRVGVANAASTYNVAVGGTIIIEIGEFPAGAYGPGTNHKFTYTIVAGDVGNPQQFLQNLWAAFQALPGSAFTLASQDWANVDEPFFIFNEAYFVNPYVDTYYFTQNARLFLNYTPAGVYNYNDVLIAEHLPDMSVSDFANAIKDGFNLTLFYNSVANVITFTPRKTQLNTVKYKDYTAKTLTEYEKEVVRTAVMKFVFENDTTDAMADAEADWCAKNSPSYDSPNAKEYRIPWGHVKRFSAMSNGLIGLWGTGDMAHVKQALGNYADVDVPDFNLRLMHWQGVVFDSTGVAKYPKGDDYFLTPDQIYTLWFKEWYEATIVGREMTKFRIMLTLQDIVAFDPELKWKIRHNSYVWKEIRMPISMRGIEPSTVIAMRINANANVLNTVSGDVVVEE